MTSTQKGRGAKIPPTPAKTASAPEEFVVSSAVIVETLKVIGNLPTHQGHGDLFKALQRSVPIEVYLASLEAAEAETETDDDPEDDE